MLNKLKFINIMFAAAIVVTLCVAKGSELK